jgi:hypothetical protein
MQKPTPRSHLATGIVGKKHTGKSTKARQLANAYAKAHPDKRVLILDVNGAPVYADLPLLTETQVRTWLPDARLKMARFYLEDNKAMLAAVQKFRGGLLIFEDCTKYIAGHPTPNVKAFLVDHRMRDLDLMFTFHAITFVPPFFWKMLNQVLLLKTSDTAAELKTRSQIPNKVAFMAAYEKLQKTKDDYAAVLVDTNI